VHDMVAHPKSPDRDGALAFGLMMKRRGFALEAMTREPDGRFALDGTVIAEPREFSRKLAHMLHRRDRRAISEGMWE